MPPTVLPAGSLFSDSDPGVLNEVEEATTQTEDPPIYSTILDTSETSSTSSSSYSTTDDDYSEADSVMDRLTRSVGRLFTMVRFGRFFLEQNNSNFYRKTTFANLDASIGPLDFKIVVQWGSE